MINPVFLKGKKKYSVASLSAGPTKTGITDGSVTVTLRALTFKHDGTAVFCGDYLTSGTPTPRLLQYNLTTAWDVSTMSSTPDASYNASGDVTTAPSTVFHTFSGLSFNQDGTKLLGFYGADREVLEYSLTSWDISTLTFVDRVSFGVASSSAPTICGSRNGKYLYACARTSGGADDVSQIEMSTGFDLTSITSNPSSFTNFTGTGSNEIDHWAITSDGKHAYALSDGDIFHFTISTQYDLDAESASTPEADTTTISAGFDDGIYVKPNGGMIFVSTNGGINSYYLSR